MLKIGNWETPVLRHHGRVPDRNVNLVAAPVDPNLFDDYLDELVLAGRLVLPRKGLTGGDQVGGPGDLPLPD